MYANRLFAQGRRILGIPNVLYANAPGNFLVKTLGFLMTKKAYEYIVVQIIADHREEHFDSLAAGNFWHAHYVVFRMYAFVVLSLAMALVGNISSAFFSTAIRLFSGK